MGILLYDFIKALFMRLLWEIVMSDMFVMLANLYLKGPMRKMAARIRKTIPSGFQEALTFSDFRLAIKNTNRPAPAPAQDPRLRVINKDTPVPIAAIELQKRYLLEEKFTIAPRFKKKRTVKNAPKIFGSVKIPAHLVLIRSFMPGSIQVEGMGGASIYSAMQIYVCKRLAVTETYKVLWMKPFFREYAKKIRPEAKMANSLTAVGRETDGSAEVTTDLAAR